LVEGRKEMDEGEEREENGGGAVEREIGDIPNLDLGAACNILEAVSNASAITLPAKFTPPPYLEGRSCVYVLEVPETSAEGGSMYYVGESDGVGKRLKAHRSKRMRGLSWSNCKGKIVEVEEGKGQARRMESEVIKRMEAMGFGMISVADKSHTNFGGGENTAS
jgi:predicted GIY-YIG superfamily endonuclease